MPEQAAWGLAKALGPVTNILRLKIADCGLTDSGATAIGDALILNNTIIVCDFRLIMCRRWTCRRTR